MKRIPEGIFVKLKNSFWSLRYLKNNICIHIETSYFLISRISQELQRICTGAGIFFNLYKVLFIYKNSGTFDDAFLIWRPSIVDFFLTKKELVSL